jgi:putative membrane protein
VHDFRRGHCISHCEPGENLIFRAKNGDFRMAQFWLRVIRLFKTKNEFKIMKTIDTMILALGVASITTGAFADESVMATNPPPMAITSQQFVQDAMAGGRKEVRLGEIALGKIQNADVKRFAERMVRDHSKANERLMKIAAADGLSFPATNMFSADDPNWSYPLISNPTGLKDAELLTLTNLPYLADYQAIQRLQSLAGDQFDQSYATEMVSDHTNAISEFQIAAESLTDKKLKAFAGKTLPTLREHYQMAVEMAGKLSGMTNSISADTNPTTRVNGFGL